MNGVDFAHVREWTAVAVDADTFFAAVLVMAKHDELGSFAFGLWRTKGFLGFSWLDGLGGGFVKESADVET